MNAVEYLERIQYTGKLNHDFDTLKALCEAHRRHVPMENLSIFGGRFKTLDLEDIYCEVVTKKRGGYCCELSSLFGWMLRELGFAVDILQASMHAEPSGPNFVHMTLMVSTSDGRQWLTDVSWTGCGFLAPLRFELDVEQEQENIGIFRIRQNPLEDDTFLVESVKKVTVNSDVDSSGAATRAKVWKLHYKFDTKPRAIDDFAATNRQQQDVESGRLFSASNTYCCLTRRDGCTLLWGNEIVTKRYDHPLTQRVVASRVYDDVAQLKRAILDEFGMRVDYDLKPVRQEHERDNV